MFWRYSKYQRIRKGAVTPGNMCTCETVKEKDGGDLHHRQHSSSSHPTLLRSILPLISLEILNTSKFLRMHFTIPFLAMISSSGWAAAVPTNQTDPYDVVSRQAKPDLTRVNSILRDARNSANEQIEIGGGRGRKLSSAPCSAGCSQCQTGAVTAAVGEIGVCGSAVHAADVASAGVATILAVTGFASCEVAVIGELNKAEAECLIIP